MKIDWISKAAQPITEEDADVYGCVLVWHDFQYCMVMGWKLAQKNQFVRFWQRTPDKPEGEGDG